VDPHEPIKRVLRLPTVPASAGAARRWITALDLPLSEEQGELLRFLANELVTNCIRHSPGPVVCLEIDVLPHAVRVATIDDGGGDGGPSVQQSSVWHTSGRGLALVDRLASRWGHYDGSGTVVWFEIDREDADQPARRGLKVGRESHR